MFTKLVYIASTPIWQVGSLSRHSVDVTTYTCMYITYKLHIYVLQVCSTYSVTHNITIQTNEKQTPWFSKQLFLFCSVNDYDKYKSRGDASNLGSCFHEQLFINSMTTRPIITLQQSFSLPQSISIKLGSLWLTWVNRPVCVQLFSNNHRQGIIQSVSDHYRTSIPSPHSL